MTISNLSEPDDSIEIHETGVSSTELKMDKAEIMDGDVNTFSQQWIEQLERNSRRILMI